MDRQMERGDEVLIIGDDLVEKIVYSLYYDYL